MKYLTLILLLAGCAHSKHYRDVLDPATGKVVARESTSFTAVLMKGEANRIRSSTKDGSYSRSFSIGSVQGQGDAEMITASGAALGEFAGKIIEHAK